MAIVVSDTFNRPDSSTTMGNANTGQAWLSDGVHGTFGISSNKAYCATPGTPPATQFMTIDSGVAGDITLLCDITLSATANRAEPGLYIKIGAANADWLILDLKKADGDDTLYLMQIVTGAFSVVASVGSFGFVNGQTYAVKVVTVGTTASVYIDNVLKIAATFNATLATYTASGIFYAYDVAAQDDLGSRHDNFVVASGLILDSPVYRFAGPWEAPWSR